MTIKFITRQSLKKLISDILPNFYVIAPVQGENVSFFKRVSVYEEIAWLDYNTVKPPKEFFFVPADDLFRFQQKKEDIILEEPGNHHDQRIILGVRPCDAAAMAALDQVFSGQDIDVLYTALRDNTLVIGQACQKPGQDCFCTSVGLSPTDTQNMDLMLNDLGGDRLLVKIITTKGEDFISHFANFFQEPDQSATPVQTEEITSFAKQPKLFDTKAIKEWLDENFEHPLWAEVATKCIGCGACTYFCPTCHCFDIADESITYRDGGYQGLRRRIWDSCSFGHFTKMPMHQPRPTQDRRYRQRVMHKFKYFVDRYQQLACVGCGRCRSLCPAGIDLVGVLEAINSKLDNSQCHQSQKVG